MARVNNLRDMLCEENPEFKSQLSHFLAVGLGEVPSPGFDSFPYTLARVGGRSGLDSECLRPSQEYGALITKPGSLQVN